MRFHSYIFTCLVSLVVVLAFGATSALAATPNWRLVVQPVPKNMPSGGAGRFAITVENIGDAPSNGEPLTVVDHLAGDVRHGRWHPREAGRRTGTG